MNEREHADKALELKHGDISLLRLYLAEEAEKVEKLKSALDQIANGHMMNMPLAAAIAAKALSEV